MIVSVIAVGVNLFFNWLFTFRLGWGHRGLALSTGCVAVTNFLLLYALMRRHVSHMHTDLLATMLAKLLLAGVALAAVCWAGEHWPPLAVAGAGHRTEGARTIGDDRSCDGGVLCGRRPVAASTEVTQVVALVRQRLRRPRSRS